MTGSGVRVCRRCGATAGADVLFCEQCGAFLGFTQTASDSAGPAETTATPDTPVAAQAPALAPPDVVAVDTDQSESAPAPPEPAPEQTPPPPAPSLQEAMAERLVVERPDPPSPVPTLETPESPPSPQDTSRGTPIADSEHLASIETAAQAIADKKSQSLSLARVREAVRGVMNGAIRLERHDIVDRLQAAETRLLAAVLTVVVVGEYKKGKSSLINALVGHDVCPVDEDTATVAPTLVRYGDQPSAVILLSANEDPTSLTQIVVDVPAVTDYLMERSNPNNVRGVRSVEIAVPSPLLQRGIVLLDTPGVGGLDSLEARTSLTALPSADAVLFVTDATQEFTAPEMAYMREAVRRCPTVICAVTKPDLFLEWRKIVDIDRGHLLRADVAVPVVAVSSELARIGRHRGDPAVVQESGLVMLQNLLDKEVFDLGDRVAARSVAQVVLLSLDDLITHVRAQIAAIMADGRSTEVTQQLETSKRLATQLRQDSARWQLTLQDGVQDLAAGVEFDIGRRVREVMIDVEKAIEENDPADIWQEFEPWVKKRVVDIAVENHEYLRQRTAELAVRVAEHFQSSAQEIMQTPADLANIALSNIDRRTPAERLIADTKLGDLGGRGVTMGLAATRSALGGTSVVTGLLGAAIHGIIPMLAAATLAPVAAVASIGFGAKVFGDMRRSDLAQRRQRAMNVARKYVDDASYVLVNDARDSLRSTQRELRDRFSSVATNLETSVSATMAAAEAARSDLEQARTQRLPALQQLLEVFSNVRPKVLELINPALR